MRQIGLAEGTQIFRFHRNEVFEIWNAVPSRIPFILLSNRVYSSSYQRLTKRLLLLVLMQCNRIFKRLEFISTEL